MDRCIKCSKPLEAKERIVYVAFPSHRYPVCTDCAKQLRDWIWKDKVANT